ncbi:hypothetical protein HYG81_19870 (plasmid) [Natrinema zhouii]|nr:hypothetical protein [Natrinema zhouii]UHQ98430.1 hypothetical protein HYG81_19870 [Natrinema zhouii]
MTDNRPGDGSHRRGESGRSIPTDRESPVGAPVIRGDESVTGTRSREVVLDPVPFIYRMKLQPAVLSVRRLPGPDSSGTADTGR